MAERKSVNPHAIFIAYPLQGHLIPSVLLAIKLASKGFTITFINTESIHHSITKSSSLSDDVFAEARKSGLDIRYGTVSDGLPISFDRSLNHDQFMESMYHVMSAHVDELVGNLIKSDPSITCLIADTFHVWPLTISKKYKLVNISFWTEPALILTLYYHMDLLKKNGHYDSLVKRADHVVDYVPGVESIKPTDMMSYLQATNTNTVTHRIIHKGIFQEGRKADFVLCNTIQELEPHTISAFNNIQPFFAIGPIFPNEFTQELVSTSLWTELDCTGWLDKKPPKSVLYLSFGSYAHISKHELGEIACGLLQSGVSFVWALRPDVVSSNDTNPLPLGFEDDIKDQGLIVPWCNQKTVISHPSIGGFLTHCGWNSILESIWCGVPLICFPLLTDQFTNRKLVVDDWKIGINLCEGNLVERDGVTKKVKDLMIGEKSNELRFEIKKVQRTLQDALAIGGSSQRNFDQFVSEVKVKINQIK